MPDDNLHYCDNNCYHKEADVTKQLDLTEVDVLIIGAGISGIGAGVPFAATMSEPIVSDY